MLQIYAFTEEVRLGEEGPQLDMSDVETLLALTELRGPSSDNDSQLKYEGYLYRYYFAPKVYTLNTGLYIDEVYNRATRTDIPNEFLEEDYTLVRFCRSARETRDLHPILKIYNESARLVREMLSRSPDAFEIRLVRRGYTFDYHLFICEKGSDSPTNQAVISSDGDGNLVYERPNYGIELATIRVPIQSNAGDGGNDSVTIKDMIGLVRDFHDRMTGMSASNTNN